MHPTSEPPDQTRVAGSSPGRRSAQAAQFHHNGVPSPSAAIWMFLVPNETMHFSGGIAGYASTPALIIRYRRLQTAASSGSPPSLIFVTSPAVPLPISETVTLQTLPTTPPPRPPQLATFLRECIRQTNPESELPVWKFRAISSRHMAFVPTTTESLPSHACSGLNILDIYTAYLAISATVRVSA